MIRKYFMYNRSLLPKLSHCGWETITEVFQKTLGRDDVMPGLVMDIQTYGRWGNWNPHLHSLCAELAEHIHSPPLTKPREGPIVYEPFFDDLPENEQMELMQRVMN